MEKLLKVPDMKTILFFALYHASVALHVPVPKDDAKGSNTFFKQSSIPEESMISSASEKGDIFDGDNILDVAQRRNNADNYNMIVKPWPTKDIPYYINNDDFNKDQIEAIKVAFDWINHISCLKFHQITDNTAGIVVIVQGSSPGCYSEVGYLAKRQVINLDHRYKVGEGCFEHGTILHEILHTLAFFHTQSRFDRDGYVKIIWDNIDEGEYHQFTQQVSPHGVDFETKYDYTSCMHYGRADFTKNGKDTIEPKNKDARIGQRAFLSPKDIKKINLLYCTEVRS